MYEGRCANGKYDCQCENIFVVAFLFYNFKECQISGFLQPIPSSDKKVIKG